MGAKSEINAHPYVSLTDESFYTSAPVILIIVGLIVFVVAFFGCCGAVKENHCMIITVSWMLNFYSYYTLKLFYLYKWFGQFCTFIVYKFCIFYFKIWFQTIIQKKTKGFKIKSQIENFINDTNTIHQMTKITHNCNYKTR